MSTDWRVGRPNEELILELLRRFLENEHTARAAISEYFNTEVDPDCRTYVWTVACTFELTR